MYRIYRKISILFVTILYISACTNSLSDIPCTEDPRCIVYGITSDILILDPHASDSIEAGIIFRQLYDTLIYRDADGDFIAGLATSWDISDDGLQYTFYLRNDVVFHDGTQFNAQSVATNIDRIFDPTINSQRARLLLGAFSRYEILDDFTIRLSLFEPYTPLLDSLSQPYLAILSPASIELYEPIRYQYHQVGTGPYILEKYLPGERIELRRNPDYSWLPSIYSKPVGSVIERVTFQIITDSSSHIDLLLNEQVDVIDKINPSDGRNLTNNSELQVLPVNIPGQSVVFYFNTTRQHISNPAVRRALLLATNRVAISDTIFLNLSPIAWSPLSQSTQFSHTSYVNQFSYDISSAIELLESQGYIDTDNDGFLDLDGDKLELEILIPPWDQLPQVGNFLRTQWRSIGVDLIINPIPGLNSLLNRIEAGTYDLVSFDVFGLEPSILNTTYSSNSPNGITNFFDEDLDRLITQATQERDIFTRRSQYLQIQSIIMDETLIIPIREYVNIVGVREGITNLKFDVYGWYPLLYDARITS